MADGIRLPDETEIDSFGEKYPALFDKEQDTKYVCPKCGDGILYGTMPMPKGAKARVSGIMDQRTRVSSPS